MLKQTIVHLLIGVLAFPVLAESQKLQGESEASVVLVSGNVDTETYSGKTKNNWNFSEMDSAILFGKYLKGETDGIESARAWDAGVRYERVISKDIFSVYAQYMIESDPYNGVFLQRNNTDLGGKYFFVKSDSLTWLGELGFRNSSIIVRGLDGKSDQNFGRGYTEANSKLNETVSSKLWFEYLSNLKDSDKSLWNAEASISVVMTSLLSLKMAYLINHNDGAVAPLEKNTTTWTTALVAKY